MMNSDFRDDQLDRSLLEKDEGFEKSNKLTIKLKNEVNSWICKICGKEFGSGKALGGHMRVHKQEEEQKNNHRYSNDVVSSGDGMKTYLDGFVKYGKLTCSHCSKSFPSSKSLFGHMRCHPERGYRGMQPPKTRVLLPEDDHRIDYSSKSRDRVDLLECLSGWTVKARRCCGTSSMINVNHCDYGDDPIPHEAIHGLMLLASGKSCYQCYPSRRRIDDLSRNKKRKMNDPYSCNICNKSFATPQALGGHTSSAHSKILVGNTSLESVEDGLVDDEDDYDIANVMQLPLSSSSSTRSPVEGERAACGFDLNEFPSDDTE